MPDPAASPALPLVVPHVAAAVGSIVFAVLAGLAWVQARALAAKQEDDAYLRYLARFCGALTLLGVALALAALWRPPADGRREAIEAVRSAAVLSCGLMALLFSAGRRDAAQLAKMRDRIAELENDLGGLVASAGEVRRQAEAIKGRAAAAATTDGLTGLASRRFYDDVIGRELKRAKRAERPMALALMEVDHFDKYVTSFGGQAGEQLLVTLAKLLIGQARDTDLLVRYGPARFAMLMPETDAEKSAELAEWVRSMVANSPFPHKADMPGGKVSVSVGVGAFPVPMTDAAGFQAAVEAALERALAERNRVKTAS